MLIWIIFLVLSAVVLTIFGVGLIEYSKAKKVSVVPTIEKGSVAGRYVDGKIALAEAVKLYDNMPMHRLSENEQRTVLYHEVFHEVAERVGFQKQAEKEDYADLAAIYALEENHGEKAALDGVDLVRKMGRADDVTAIDTIEKWLEGEKLTNKERKTIESGRRKMNNLYAVANEYESGGGVPGEYSMQAFPKAMQKTIGSIPKAIWDGIDAIKTIYRTSNEINNELTALAKTPGKESNGIKALGTGASTHFWKTLKKYTGGGA